MLDPSPGKILIATGLSAMLSPKYEAGVEMLMTPSPVGMFGGRSKTRTDSQAECFVYPEIERIFILKRATSLVLSGRKRITDLTVRSIGSIDVLLCTNWAVVLSLVIPSGDPTAKVIVSPERAAVGKVCTATQPCKNNNATVIKTELQLQARTRSLRILDNKQLKLIDMLKILLLYFNYGKKQTQNDNKIAFHAIFKRPFVFRGGIYL